jgi:hypothetical protein
MARSARSSSLLARYSSALTVDSACRAAALEENLPFRCAQCHSSPVVWFRLAGGTQLAIRELLEKLNQHPFQKRAGSPMR